MLGRSPRRKEKRFKSLTNLIAEELKESIASGKIVPGERLSEEKLGPALNVTHVPLREAFRLLEAEGYVTFLPNREVVVSKPTIEEVEDYYEIASVLEGLAARLAVERADDEEIARLRELHQLLKEAYQRRNLQRYYEANSNFHRFIAEIARNERLFRMIDEMREGIQKTRILAFRLPKRLDYSMREHDQILDALVKKNAELAEAVVVKHLNHQMLSLKEFLEGGQR